MPAIIKQRQLRSGDLEFSATTATDVDQYMVTCDERVSKVQMAELFVAKPGNPVPRGTIKQLGSGYLICDSIRCSQPSSNAGFIWLVHVRWKEIESDNPDSRDYPTPKGNSTDPADWSPSWTKRTQVVYEPARTAYYKGGYTGDAHTKFSGYDPDKAPILNSANQEVARTPERRRLIEVWSFRWLRTLASNTLLNAENKLNDDDFTITLPGLNARTWAAETALIDTIDLSNRRWGAVDLVEINIEIIVDPNGWEWAIRDQGTAARAEPGDPDGNGGTLSFGDMTVGKPRVRQILDESDHPVQDSVLLDGDGQPLDTGDDPVYGQWLDLDVVAFDTLPYIEELV